MIRKILLGCGFAASVLYVSVDILASRLYPGYSYVDQTVSELFAVGAPTRALYLTLGLAYPLLWFAFGIGIWLSAGRRFALRVIAAGLIGKEVLGTAVALFFPIHQRAVLAAGGATYTDAWHRNLTVLGVMFFLIAVGFGATLFGRWFRLYSIATVVALALFGTLSFLQAPQMAANQATPLMGVWERINIFGYLLWAVVLTILLLRGQASAAVQRHSRHALPAMTPRPAAR